MQAVLRRPSTFHWCRAPDLGDAGELFFLFGNAPHHDVVGHMEQQKQSHTRTERAEEPPAAAVGAAAVVGKPLSSAACKLSLPITRGRHSAWRSSPGTSATSRGGPISSSPAGPYTTRLIQMIEMLASRSLLAGTPAWQCLLSMASLLLSDAARARPT